MPKQHTAIVDAWIQDSPHRYSQAVTTAALRHSSTQSSITSKHRMPWIGWLSAVAACIALLVALPLLHKRSSAPHVIDEAGPRPLPSSQPNSGDTILLEVHRLRGTGKEGENPATYNLHAGRSVRIQVIVPTGSDNLSYTLDLQSPANTSPIHLIGQKVNNSTAIKFIEFSVPPNQLPAGIYEGNLQSVNGSYHLRFSIAYAN